MAESSVHLQGEIALTVAQADVGSERHLGCGLAGYVSVATIAEVNGAVAIEVGKVVTAVAVAIIDDAGAVWQVENAEGLPHYLVDHVVVASVLTCPRERANGGDGGCRHLHAVIVAAEGEQLVFLPRHVHVDVKVYVLLCNGC